jgi:uncharacterized protein YbjT (DUF2867 family)
MNAPKTVVIAGGTGCVGSAVARRLGAEWRVVILSRDPPKAGDPKTLWRRCDLFSLLQCERALEGADSAVYLVHSMLPSAHLTQGAFQDMDLVLADNFARAAAQARVRHIVYLGGLVPNEPQFSRHLKSRLEVSHVLGARGVPVTSLRSGIIIGQGSASFDILEALVRRLPVIPCPRWTLSRTQPVALEDVVELIRYSLELPARGNQSFDISSPEALSYLDMMERIAKILGVRRRFVPVALTDPIWFRRLLNLITGVPVALIGPLLESARHTLVARDRSLQDEAGVPGQPFDEAARRAIAGAVRETARPAPRTQERDVRSVQRIPLPAGKTARWAVLEYCSWLPLVFKTLLRAETDSEMNIRFILRLPRLSLLELTYARDRSLGEDRQVFYITGGLLARKTDRSEARPRLEFREVLRGSFLLIAIHDYLPTLPWPLYNLTQARLHLRVMRAFALHIVSQR